jgi:hypothetical protein
VPAAAFLDLHLGEKLCEVCCTTPDSLSKSVMFGAPFTLLRLLRSCRTLLERFKLALQACEQSLVFYSGLQETAVVLLSFSPRLCMTTAAESL